MNRTSILVVFFITFIILLQNVISAEINLVPKLEICSSQNCFDSSKEIILRPDNPVFLKVTIINDQNKLLDSIIKL